MAGRQKNMTGRVVSDKMDKTVVVMVESTKRHRLYHKVMRRSKRYLAHDEGDAKPGDLVRIEETRPASRHKRWRVAEILRRGEVAEVAPREIDSEYLSKEREVQAPPPPPPRKDPTDEPETGDAEADATPTAEVATQDPEASTEASEEPAAEAAEASDDDASDDDAPEEPAAEAVDSEEAPSEDTTEEPASDSDDDDSTTPEEEEKA